MKIVFAAVLLLAACAPDRPEFPLVQASSNKQPSRIVSFNRSVSGRFRAISPRCDIARPGQTVEFRNFAPELPLLLTGVDGNPALLYSPNVARPYQVVAAKDGVDAFAYWRHTFDAPGVYDYFDAASGDPGRKITDPYYGTVTFVGTAGNATKGTLCIGDDATCDGKVCCTSSDACPSGQVCVDGPNGRCTTPND